MASTKVRYDDMNMKQVLEGVDGIICIGKFEKKYLDTFQWRVDARTAKQQ